MERSYRWEAARCLDQGLDHRTAILRGAERWRRDQKSERIAVSQHIGHRVLVKRAWPVEQCADRVHGLRLCQRWRDECRERLTGQDDLDCGGIERLDDQRNGLAVDIDLEVVDAWLWQRGPHREVTLDVSVLVAELAFAVHVIVVDHAGRNDDRVDEVATEKDSYVDAGAFADRRGAVRDEAKGEALLDAGDDHVVGAEEPNEFEAERLVARASSAEECKTGARDACIADELATGTDGGHGGQPYPQRVVDDSSLPVPELELIVDGVPITFVEAGQTLLDVLADAGIRSVKDGCSPQGQCGCCTVLVDGQPRVSCVTPARRVKNRSITTVDGLDPERTAAWGEALCATGGSQCGFCTPGIVVRLDALEQKSGLETAGVEQALLAHLCRCTGWQTITEAAEHFVELRTGTAPSASTDRDLDAAARRATIEGRAPQRVSPDVALGRGGFAVDTAPDDALIAVPTADGSWVVGETLAEARNNAGKVQGRRTTMEPTWPVDLPEHDPADVAASLRTTWVEPAYLETDAAWCEPGGEPADPIANGGAFGAKGESDVKVVARRLADEHGRTVLALASREHTVVHGTKRPPVSGWARADGTGAIRVVRTPGLKDAINAVAPGLVVEERSVFGPPTSMDIRAAGWAEATILLAGAAGVAGPVTSPEGAIAEATVDDGVINVRVQCGEILDEAVLRSYCIGAAHMAWSWLTSEGLAVDDKGEVHDLTVRSFGVVRAVDTPMINVELVPDDGPSINGSDAVFVAVAAAGWLRSGCIQDWPIGVFAFDETRVAPGARRAHDR